MNGIRTEVPLEEVGTAISFDASNIRKERTGVHARLVIFFDGVMLVHSWVNTDRDEDRTRLANAAVKRIPDVFKPACPNGVMKHSLDTFCFDLWERHINRAGFRGELMAGDPDIGPPKLVAGPYILEGGGTLLFGPPGRGKSTTAMAMVASSGRIEPFQ